MKSVDTAELNETNSATVLSSPRQGTNEDNSLVATTKSTKKTTAHICDICGRGFTARRLLRFHQHIHVKYDNMPYGCDICGRRYAYPYGLRRHQRLKHGNVKPSSQ